MGVPAFGQDRAGDPRLRHRDDLLAHAEGIRLERVAHGVTEKRYSYAANQFCTAEHGDTHLDAPIHFFEGRHTADGIPIEQLVGLSVVVDVSAKCASDRDYRIQPADFEA